MFETFDSKKSRYAPVGVVSSLPGELIDSIWYIIDLDLKGLIPLDNILSFDLINNDGRVTMHFSQEGSSVEMGIDLPFGYSNDFPQEVYAYDTQPSDDPFAARDPATLISETTFLKGCLFFLNFLFKTLAFRKFYGNINQKIY